MKGARAIDHGPADRAIDVIKSHGLWFEAEAS
jgi:hypothetical protein